MSGSFMKSFNYSIGFFGLSIPINMLKTYAAAYYVMTKGVTTAEMALMLLIYTFIDAADNPIYGFLSDRTRSRWGRRKPWLTIATPMLVLGLIFFYNPPAFLAGQSLVIYFMLFYMLTGTLDSVLNANYGALFPELFRGDEYRASTNALRQAFQLVAMVISIALTPMVTGKLGYGLTSILYGALGGVAILYMTFTSKETAIRAEEAKPELWKSLVDLARNGKFWVAGLAGAFYSAAMSLSLVAMPFFVKYTLKLDNSQTTWVMAPVLFVAMFCVAIWVQLVKRFGLIRIWRIALLALALTYVPLFFANNLVTAIIGSALLGLAYAGVLTTNDLIGAKIMDEDTQKYGLRREGIISNAMGFMNRLNGLFTSAAFLLVGMLYGYVSGDNPGPQPDNAARFLLTVCPPVLMLISFGFSWLIDFKKAEEPKAIPQVIQPE